jgi:succinoglycan biosynthesis transport protein ExoP
MPSELNDQTLRSWQDYRDIAIRRRWWIILSTFLVWAMVWGVSWLLPPTYQSEALILVEQQKVPDQYVMPNVSASLQDRVQSISQQILSRTRLQATIDRFHLYPRRRGLAVLLNLGDPIDQMRKDITIDLVRASSRPGEFTAFKIRYTAGSPELAQRVNADLTSLFVTENVQAQQRLSENTTSFLENQLADARAKMAVQEAKVAAFKAAHLGELPSQLETNVQILNGIQSQLQNTHQAIDSATQQKLYLESLLQQYESVQTELRRWANQKGAAGGAADSMMVPGRSFDKELVDLQARLQDLQSRYTDSYPDVVALKDKIANLEKLRKLSESETMAVPNSRKTDTAAERVAMQNMEPVSSNSIMQLESQLKANQLEIENYQRHEKDLESQISEYRARLNLTPETEEELIEISRGYEESKANYNSLLQKQMQSQLATSLEQRQQGEQFRVIDPPSLPKKPVGPNHLKFSLAGFALGIVLGVGLAALLEQTDVRVRQEKDLKDLVPVRVLVSIPRLRVPGESESRAVGLWLEIGAVTIVFVLMAIGNLYAVYKR